MSKTMPKEPISDKSALGELLIDMRRSMSSRKLSRAPRRPSFPPSLKMPHEDRHYPAPKVLTAEIRRVEPPADALPARLSPRDYGVVNATNVRLISATELRRSEQRLSRLNSQRTENSDTSGRSMLSRVFSSRQNSGGIDGIS